MFIELNNAPIYVKTSKTARAKKDDALLLHGVPDSAEIWNPVIEKIQHKYDCYAPDLPGFYRSGMPDNFQFTLDHYADYVDQLVEALNLRTPLTLVIHDWGGIFGMLWACKYPHKVKRIIGGDFPFSHLYSWHEWATVWRTPILGELAMATMNWPIFKWEMNRGSRHLDVNSLKTQYQHVVKQRNTRKVILNLYRSADMHLFTHWSSLQRQLSEKVPIDIVWGKNDVYVSTHQARLFHSRSVTVIPDCGHWAPSEAPREFSQVVLKG